VGQETPNLLPLVIARLRSEWEDQAGWQRRDLSAPDATSMPGWADGDSLQARMEPQAECVLVLIGATPEGRSCSASISPCAKARKAGASCWPTSRPAAWLC
jgi:putative transposase